MGDLLGLNLRHLDAISVIGRLGSMSAGAQRVSLSQPALAQAVSKVERVLGERLFERQPTGMSPTPAGRILIIRIDRALRFLTQGVRLVRRSARLPPVAHIERWVTMAQLRALIAVERIQADMHRGRCRSVCRNPRFIAQFAIYNTFSVPNY
jgi:LysR family transcriptional regulator, regulator for genes of the gallate degradation pathway